MNFHPAANIFPMMTGADFDALVADIAEHGQREAIVMYDGMILDGRNRYRACERIGLAPVTREWEGGASAVEYVVSLNLHRRHLDNTQRAVIAFDMLPLLEAEARERMLAGVAPDPTQRIAQGEAREQAAAITGTNRQYVSDVKRIAAEAPELLDDMRSGKMTVTQAKREVVRLTAPAQPPTPTGKYRVIYADPPWKYGDALMISKDGIGESYGPAIAHYPAMSIAELCALPIKDIAEPDAVLFMWVTSPLLEEAFPVIAAWGFKYKASFVWDKIKHNMGHYNSVRHEFLLVCTRGSCQPDERQLFDSVQSIERTEHSTKPEEFRTIIDTIYPHGERIELFARRAAVGWQTWGNEVEH